MEIGLVPRAPSSLVDAPPTPSRRYAALLLASLARRPRPTTAQELFAALRADGERAGLATIYRALHALQSAGAVHAIRRSDEFAYRVCTATLHDHLVCEVCGAVDEVPRAQLDQWFSTAALTGFRPSAEPQQIGAVCPRCGAVPE